MVIFLKMGEEGVAKGKTSSFFLMSKNAETSIPFQSERIITSRFSKWTALISSFSFRLTRKRETHKPTGDFDG